MAIDRYDETIDDDDVDSRIAELDDDLEYEVVRLRNDEVLFTDADEDTCRTYIEDEDYNPDKVIVRRQELDPDDAEELSRLRDLKDEAEAELGSTYFLARSSYFSESWARDEAAEVLGGRIDLDEWPFTEVDWSDAADARRDEQFSATFTYDGETYYGRER